MVKAKAKNFNWKGITENLDGSFTTDDKRGKTRVLKALHEQGISVRSTKNPDGTWTVTPVGTTKSRRRASMPVAVQGTGRRINLESGRRINTRESGFPMYPRGQSLRRRGGSFPQSYHGGSTYRGGPQVSRPSGISQLGKKLGEYMRERKIRQEQKRKEEAEFQEMRQEINEKMKKERIEYELKEQREEARRQLEKNRLRGESYGDMSGDLKTSLHNADVKAEQRRVNDTVERQQAQRQQRQYAKNQEHTHGGWTSGIARAPEIPKQKVDPATLQHARENVVKGED